MRGNKKLLRELSDHTGWKINNDKEGGIWLPWKDAGFNTLQDAQMNARVLNSNNEVLCIYDNEELKDILQTI